MNARIFEVAVRIFEVAVRGEMFSRFDILLESRLKKTVELTIFRILLAMAEKSFLAYRGRRTQSNR